MTKTLTFAGYSDDTFSCRGKGIDVDHDNCANGNPIMMRVKSGRLSLIAVGFYALGPCAGWLVGVSPDDGAQGDETPIPPWPIRIVPGERPYAPTMIVDAPDDVEVFLIDERGRKMI
jgi:hypothetical protein